LTPDDDERDAESRLRLNLSVQKSRAVVFTLATLVGLLDRALGGLRMDYAAAPLFLAYGAATAYLFHELYRRGLDRRLGIDLFLVWTVCDIGVITFAIHLSADRSYWFLWYLSVTAGAAFVQGGRAALGVGAGNTVAYLAAAALATPETIPDRLAQAFTRLTYLYGVSFFLILGIAGLRDKQLLIRRLRRADEARLGELTQLTEELDRRGAELDRANAQLRESAVTDSLTGLHNRRFLEAQIATDVAAVHRAYGDATRGRPSDPLNRALGLLLVDIDHFKKINDIHGHDAGDRVICGTADVLRRCVRLNDSVVRWGGEEFLLVARQAKPGFLPIVALRVLRSMREHAHALPAGNEVHITCSVGWSFYPLTEEPGRQPDWRLVLKLADMGLYLAKRNGRNMAVGIVPGPCPLPDAGVEAITADVDEAVRCGYLRIESSGPVKLSNLADAAPGSV
jgi:diguanylate cyclase (GGDEF)-like protein